MAITNLYSNLPGHLVEFKDGGLALRDTTVSSGTKSLLILGTATDGPINEPVAIDVDSVAKLFGEDYTTDSAGNQVPNGTTLTKIARQAYRAGFEDIRCMRVTGTQASASLSANSSETTEVIAITPMEITANGNIEKTFSIAWPNFDESTQYPVIKNGAASYSGTSAGCQFPIANYSASQAPSIHFAASIFPAKGSVVATWDSILVNKTLKTATGATIEDTGATDATTGDCIIKITTPAITDIYDYDMTTKEVGTDTTDIYGVADADKVVEVNDGTVNPVYNLFKVTVAGVEITSDKLTVTKNTQTNVFEITYIETGTSGSTAITQDTVVTVEYKGYDLKTQASETYTIASMYEPIEVELEKVPLVNENNDIILYAANGTTAIAKMSDSTNAISYDIDGNKVKIDLTKVQASIPISYYTVNSTLKLAYSYEETTQNTEEITFRSTYAGSIYNDCSVTATKIINDAQEEGVLITLTKPESKKYSTTEMPLEYSSFAYPTFGQLKAAIESTINSPLNNVFEVVTDTEDALVKNIVLAEESGSTTKQFTGGSDGVNPTNDEYFVALSGVRNEEGYLEQQGAYQILENYSCDYIYVAGIYSDSTVSAKLSVIPQPFHYELALLCAVLTFRTKMTHGFIDVKPNTNTTLVGIQKYVEHLTSLPNEFVIRNTDASIIKDEDNNVMDIGWYTSCVVGPQILCTSATLGNYYGSPAIAYAALNGGLAAYSAPTNKRVPGCSAMRFKFSNKQMNELTGNRMVVFKYKNEGTNNASTYPYVVDGCTCGLSSSDYTRFTTVKVVTQVVDEVREVSDPFIGEPNTVEQRNALAALISKRLSYLKAQGVIQYYEFEITATNYQVLLGECSIALTLVAPQELRKITTVVALRATA